MKRLSAARPGIPYCYILQCADGSFYTGWTNDLPRRYRQHNTGNGGRYTRSRCPVILVYFEPQADGSMARKREAAIKQLPRTKKAELIAGKRPAKRSRLRGK
ncbi:MAG: GIY-YIG nuclease family protein [Anaerolineales bacterium]|nr:GIY-YIG nuclease family protein [Anaerolineales bacterium]